MPLISVKEAQDMMGADYPAAVHSFAKKWGVVKTKKGNRTYFDKKEFQDAMKKAESEPPKPKKSGRKSKGKGKKTGDSSPKKRGPMRAGVGATYHDEAMAQEVGFVPFKADARYLAWNKGVWRGWCFAAVKDVDPDIMKVITHELKEHEWTPEAMRLSIAKGEAFVLEPEAVLRFIAMQTLHLLRKDQKAHELSKKALALAIEFEEWKKEVEVKDEG